MRERRFADERHTGRRQFVERREVVEQPFERRPELILGSPGNGGIVKFGPGFGAKGRDDARKCHFWQ